MTSVQIESVKYKLKHLQSKVMTYGDRFAPNTSERNEAFKILDRIDWWLNLIDTKEVYQLNFNHIMTTSNRLWVKYR